MFLQRQISASLVEGEKISLADGVYFPYKLTDVLPKYILRLGEGQVSSGYLELAATESSVLQLPANYVNTDRLSVIIRTNQIVKCVVVSPDHGSSTFLTKSTDSTDEGEHLGPIMWQGTVTSITLSIPATFSSALIEYFMFVIPDLSEPTSYRLGQTALGYISE